MDIEIKIKLSQEQIRDWQEEGRLDLTYTVNNGNIRIILMGE